MRVALLQLCATENKSDNIAKALTLAGQALRQSARFILFPEVFNFRGDLRNKELLSSVAESIPGPSTKPFSLLAQQNKVHVLLGSLLEKSKDGEVYNTSVLISPTGQIKAKYRKINLFDARIGDKIIRESDCFKSGKSHRMADVDEFSMGLSICYDLRFSRLYESYARRGANMLAVPSCFTRKTGEAHWESLLRARAIENLSYVLAPNQVGTDARGMQAYGHSMIISPWGEILARGSGDNEEIVLADINKEEVYKARAVLPGIIKG